MRNMFKTLNLNMNFNIWTSKMNFNIWTQQIYNSIFIIQFELQIQT